MRYSLSVLLARIDEEYAVFPHMAKKKRAGDKPSHLVLKFLTGEMIVNFLTNAPFERMVLTYLWNTGADLSQVHDETGSVVRNNPLTKKKALSQPNT